MPRGFQHLEDFTDLVVQIRDIGKIRAARFSDIVLGDIKAAPVIGVENPFRMRVLIVIAKVRNLRQQMFTILVQIPVFLARDIRIMRMGKADGHAPRAVVLAARQIIQLGLGVIGDLIIIFHLVGNLGHTRACDRPHIVIPPVDPLARLAIIGRPAKIGGVDIGGQAVFEPMQLIGADEMHLARQAGVIPRAAQVVGIGGDITAELGRIVIDAGA